MWGCWNGGSINKGKGNKGQNALNQIFQLSKIIQWIAYGFSFKKSFFKGASGWESRW